MTKRPTLDSAFAEMTAIKPVAPAAATIAPPAPPVAEPAATKTLTLRLDVATWRHLRQVALDRETSMHALLLEGLGVVFERHNQP